MSACALAGVLAHACMPSASIDGVPPVAVTSPVAPSPANGPAALIAVAPPRPASEPETARPPPAPELAPEACAAPAVWLEADGPTRSYSAHGYRASALPLTRIHGDRTLHHCVIVLWPGGTTNAEGAPCRVAERIDPAWFRAIENTLARVPFDHVRTLRRVVIDNRPTEHGIAAFDRERADDGRDGHTIWLNEHLFTGENHWANGNYGVYWSYHTSLDAAAFDGQRPDHALFSPVLLHELGHLVMYNLVNAGADRTSAPACARTCADSGTCAGLSPAEREMGCVTPYCTPFRFQAGTENFAEQYRLYYQSSQTRGLLEDTGASCVATLADADANHVSPWNAGLPDVSGFKKSLWLSCGGRACKRL